MSAQPATPAAHPEAYALKLVNAEESVPDGAAYANLVRGGVEGAEKEHKRQAKRRKELREALFWAIQEKKSAEDAAANLETALNSANQQGMALLKYTEELRAKLMAASVNDPTHRGPTFKADVLREYEAIAARARKTPTGVRSQQDRATVLITWQGRLAHAVAKHRDWADMVRKLSVRVAAHEYQVDKDKLMRGIKDAQDDARNTKLRQEREAAEAYAKVMQEAEARRLTALSASPSFAGDFKRESAVPSFSSQSVPARSPSAFGIDGRQGFSVNERMPSYQPAARLSNSDVDEVLGDDLESEFARLKASERTDDGKSSAMDTS